MKIALAQLNYTVGDFDLNKVKIINSIYEAKEQGAELVVFAEFAISGTPAYDMLNKIPFLEACEESLVEIASHCEDIAVVVGLPLLHDNKVVSAAALIQNRKVVRYVGKQNISSRDELGFISPSAGCEFAKVNDKKVAIVVGEDILTEQDFGHNADLVVCLHSDPYARAIIETRYKFLKGYSFRSGKPIAFVNQLGGQTEILFDGSSCLYNEHGDAIALLKNFEEDLAVIDLSADNPAIEEPLQNKTANVYKGIKLALKDYFTKNNFTKACVGLSGGIDSAVVIALAAEVLGPKNVRGLMMPSEFSSDHSVRDALELADNLGIGFNVVPLDEVYRSMTDTMKPVIGGTGFDTTEENIQARLRMVMLMSLSNKFGYIVLNTGNKSEDAIGYSTLYGDMAGSFSIIGDLYKTEVYDLARYINRFGEIIPENILLKEPSAELRPNQKDSDSLPVYDVLDAILYRFIEEGQSVEEIQNAGFESDMITRTLDLIKKTEYKRRQGCPVLRLSTKPFASGFILPLTNKFKL